MREREKERGSRWHMAWNKNEGDSVGSRWKEKDATSTRKREKGI